jgi:hypothetical protein
MTTRGSAVVRKDGTVREREGKQPETYPNSQPAVPRVIRETTDDFIKKYKRTLRDLEKY